MAGKKTNFIGREKDAVNTLVDKLTLFDDDLMSRVFDQNVEATELVLRIILGRNIRVISVNGQNELKNHEVGGRNITLDVHAIDVNGEEMDIEVQGNFAGAHIRRARYHSSMVDSRMLRQGQAFKELKDSYVIFIYRHDKFKRGLPLSREQSSRDNFVVRDEQASPVPARLHSLYHIDRYVRETKELFEDGSHIIYVNGNYKGNDEIGQLMKDFHQANPENIHYDALAQGVKHFKENEEGREQMCEAVEKFAKEYAREYAEEYAIKGKVVSVKNLMQNMKLTLDQALNALGIQGEEREQIIEQLQNE